MRSQTGMQAELPASVENLLPLLQKCRQKKDVHEAQRLHACARRHRLDSHAVLGNYLVPMLVECGNLRDAQEAFDRLPQQNEHSWTSLISGYINSGQPQLAFNLYRSLQAQEYAQPNRVTYLALLNACARTMDANTGQELHVDIVRRGLERDVFMHSAMLGNTLVDMYGKCGMLAEACQVFDGLPLRNIVSWNAMIAAYAEQGLARETKECFLQMRLEGIRPDCVTLVSSLKACGTIGALQTGQEMHCEATKIGFETELYVGNSLVDMYTKCNLLVDAHQVFHRLPIRDAITWAGLIAGYAKHGLDEEVLESFKQMQLENVATDATTFVLCLKSCGSLGALETGREVHADIRKSGLDVNLFVGSILVDMYGRCGSIKEAQEVFDKLPDHDVTSWTAMIKAYGENHDSKAAIQCFKEMQEQRIKPDSITFTCLLAACSHGNLALVGQEYFKKMIEKYEIKPTFEHYSCMVDLFARSGCIHEAVGFLAAMQCPPSRAVVTALLSACKIYGKLELGQQCFQQLVELNQDDASAYLMMAEIYADVGRCKDANKVEEMRNYMGAQKRPGNAFVEVNKKLHQFVVAMNQCADVVEMLELISSHIKCGGYVPNVESDLKNISYDEKEAVCDELVDATMDFKGHTYKNISVVS